MNIRKTSKKNFMRSDLAYLELSHDYLSTACSLIAFVANHGHLHSNVCPPGDCLDFLWSIESDLVNVCSYFQSKISNLKEKDSSVNKFFDNVPD